MTTDPRTRDIPVIFLSGLDGTADKLKGFGVGASDHIAQPYRADELIARLQVHQSIRRRLLNALPPASVPQAQAQPPSRIDRRLQAAMDILRQEMAQPPTLLDLARRVGSNERTLTDLFRQRFGMPVFAWLREERFRRACDLLLGSDQAIGEIGTAIGYGSAAAFTTSFRERYGMTPSAYRRSAGLAADRDETAIRQPDTETE